MTGELVPGMYRLEISADGYAPAECPVLVPDTATLPAVPASGAWIDAQVDCPLQSLPRTSVLAGEIVGRAGDDSHAPIAEAELVLIDGAGREHKAASDAAGKYRFEAVEPGTVRLRAHAAGFGVREQHLNLEPRRGLELTLVLEPERAATKSRALPSARKPKPAVALPF